MAPENFENRMRVGIIGGLRDKKKDLLRNAQPLVDAGYRVAAMDGGWFSGETTAHKFARAQKFLDEWQPEVLYGPSAGGLLAIVVGFNNPNVHRIVTAASPLHWPEKNENTPKIRMFQVAVPSLRKLGNIYYEKIKGHLHETNQQFLHIRGTEDELVPPTLSKMDGADESMRHIEHVIFETPPKHIRKLRAHTFTTTEVFHFPRFQGFVAGGEQAASPA